jgi:DsbC/DsbD-like thiol-disulfide interchange protein
MNFSAAISRLIPMVAILAIGVRDVRANAVPFPHGTVELIAENQSIAPGARIDLGLHFKLEKGWHIYWQNPGDSGQPPRAEWKLPAGFIVGAMEWPAPHRMGSPTIVDYGYDDEVTILVPLHSSATQPANQNAQISADLKLLICKDICISGKAQVSLAIPVQNQPAIPNGQTRELFTAARKSLPRPAPTAWKVKGSDASESFQLSANPGHSVKSAMFFPMHESEVDNAAPQKLTPSDSGFQLTLHKSDELLKPIARLQGVLVLGGNEAYTIDAPISHAGALRK